MTGWQLPRIAQIGGKIYHLRTDYRQILEIFQYLQDESYPEFFRWPVALALFFEEEVPEEDTKEAIAYFCRFVNGGQEEVKNPGPALLDWEQDAQVIVSDVNRAAGQEIRELPYLHWWTFLGWFHSIGDGGLATLVSIRRKLQKGQKLEDWEREYCRQNQVPLRKKYSARELAEQERLNALLG